MNRRFAAIRNLGLAAVLTAAALGLATGAAAQTIPDTGGRVFGLVGGSFGDGGSAVMTSGGAGLRLTSRLRSASREEHRSLGEPLLQTAASREAVDPPSV